MCKFKVKKNTCKHITKTPIEKHLFKDCRRERTNKLTACISRIRMVTGITAQDTGECGPTDDKTATGLSFIPSPGPAPPPPGEQWCGNVCQDRRGGWRVSVGEVREKMKQ